MNGIFHITGETGVGKTSLALGRKDVKPSEIAVYNFDGKPYPVVGKGKYRGYKFYRSYLSILEDTTQAKPEHALVQAVLGDFHHAQGARVVILDAWEIFAKSWTSYFLERSIKYKIVIGGGQFAQMSRLGHAPKVEVSMLDKLMTEFGVETIFVINHLMDEYDSPDGSDKGVKTGRKVPESNKRLEQKASVRIWLKHNSDHRCPIGVVLKDPGIHEYHEGRGIVPCRLFPPRLSPKALGDVSGKDVTLWDVIEHYQNNPIGARPLHDFEEATEEEFAMMAGTLTPTQRAVWENNLALAIALGDNYDSDLVEKITEAKGEGKSAIEIYRGLKDTYDISLPQVIKTYNSV